MATESNAEIVRERAIAAANKKIADDLAAKKALDALNSLSGAVNKADKSFVRNAAAEAAAIASGNITKEEIEARGGVNASGYFGDSWNPNTSLTDAEYAAAVAKGGGSAVNAATQAKVDAYNKSIGAGNNTGGSKTPPPSGAVKNSAYDLLLAEFTKYGLGSLVSDIKNFITNDTSSGELTLLLRNTEAYKKRFAANAARIEKGLTALDEKAYLDLEDAYQNIMRNYGLPDTYWKKDSMGTQEGFTKLITNDVSATELEDRIMTAQNRVVNANPQVKQALKQFYPDITDADILAYALDPQKALTDIKRKVTAAEIGGAALGQGLATSQLGAEGLAAYGVTKQQAEQGYGQIAELLPTSEKLSQIYQEQPYNQQQAEAEIFNLAGSAEASRRRKKLAETEKATFSGSSGMSSGALSRDRALNGQTYGAGSY